MKPFVIVLTNSGPSRRGLDGTSRAEERIIFGELDRWMAGVNRPRVVLDCSQLDEMGQPEVRLLMSCLERVMKRNGDARLAGVSSKAMETLACTGAERLFRIYDSSDAAIKSFESHSNLEVLRESRHGSVRDARNNGDG